jgi:hypothetical protein
MTGISSASPTNVTLVRSLNAISREKFSKFHISTDSLEAYLEAYCWFRLIMNFWMVVNANELLSQASALLTRQLGLI